MVHDHDGWLLVGGGTTTNCDNGGDCLSTRRTKCVNPLIKSLAVGYHWLLATAHILMVGRRPKLKLKWATAWPWPSATPPSIIAASSLAMWLWVHPPRLP
eukprot:scaffold3006_cov111-Isochrysis_galbana.AAC.5